MHTSIRKLQVGAAAASLLLVTALVLRVSDAAFSTTTDDPGNSWSSGQVALSDSGAGSAMFSVTDMVPGQTETRCINVTYTGSVDPGAVKLYASVTDSGLADYLNVTVREGSSPSGAYPSCTGFVASGTIVNGVVLSTVGTTYTDYASGAGTWDPASGAESTGYQFEITLDAAAPGSTQGTDAGATFTWETTT